MPRNSLGFIPAEMDERQALSNLLEALQIASAASRQLGYMRSESDWFRISQQFGTLRQMCVMLGSRRPEHEITDPALIGAKQ
jgi:hypothetical protein